MNTHNGYASHPDGDLDLLALRYVAGELSADEHQEFETRLLDDQQARDSVAHAVAIAQAVALDAADRGAEPVRAGVSAGTAWRFAAAAVLVLGLGLSVWLGGLRGSDDPTGTDLADEAARDLIQSWAEFHDLHEDGEPIAVELEEGLVAGTDLVEAEPDGSPSWMVQLLAK